MSDWTATGAHEPRRRVVVISNPTAGRSRRYALDRVLAGLRLRGCAVALHETATRGDAEAIASTIGAQGADAVVAAGGDGTVNEVINGLQPGSPPLALVPLGTANVLAAELGLPRRPPQAVARLIVDGPARAAWPGLANGRRFMMMAGIGFDAQVVAAVDLALKRSLGRYAYLLQGVRHLRRGFPAHYRVRVEGVELTAASVIVSRTQYYAGRFLLAPGASLFEPRLEVFLFSKAEPADILRGAVALLRGRITDEPNVRLVRAREVTVTEPAGEPVQCDGDIACSLPAHITVAERPVRLIIRPSRSDRTTRPEDGLLPRAFVLDRLRFRDLRQVLHTNPSLLKA
jgi:diacylglycerol kinase (ATP)